jgi:hypothetical protein
MFLFFCTGGAKINAPPAYAPCGLCPGLSPGSGQISIINTFDISSIICVMCISKFTLSAWVCEAQIPENVVDQIMDD